MCGIAGVIKFGDKPIEESVLALMLLGNEHRGADASGIALSQEDGSIDIFKTNVQAWRFVKLKEYTEFIQSKLKPTTWAAILHTRFATVGDPQCNENNHPLYAGHGTVIHNGGIHNSSTIFDACKFERKAEVDSDILRAFVDAHGITPKCIREMNRLAGPAAGAAFHPDYPKKILLFKSGSPMILSSDDDFFYFASEKKTLYKAMRPYVNRWNMWFQVERPNAAFSPMAEDTAWLISEEGQEGHYEFKTMNGKYLDAPRPVHTKFEDRGSKKSSRLHVVHGKSSTCQDIQDVICPECKHRWIAPVGVDLSTFNCEPKEKGSKDAPDGCGHKGLVAVKDMK